VKGSGAGAVLHLLLATGGPMVKTAVVPPELNPVASDIVSRNCDPFGYGNCGIEYEPLPLLKADAGTAIAFPPELLIWQASG